MARYSVKLSADGERHIVVCVDQKDYYSQQLNIESKEKQVLHKDVCDILDNIFEQVDENNTLEDVLAREKQPEVDPLDSMIAIIEEKEAVVDAQIDEG